MPLGDRLNMAYLSTSVAYGRGEGVVVATGMKTEIGKIASMISESVDEMTPLQKRLGFFGKSIRHTCHSPLCFTFRCGINSG